MVLFLVSADSIRMRTVRISLSTLSVSLSEIGCFCFFFGCSMSSGERFSISHTSFIVFPSVCIIRRAIDCARILIPPIVRLCSLAISDSSFLFLKESMSFSSSFGVHIVPAKDVSGVSFSFLICDLMMCPLMMLSVFIFRKVRRSDLNS